MASFRCLAAPAVSPIVRGMSEPTPQAPLAGLAARIRAGVKRDGTFTFRDIGFLHDNGGYTSWEGPTYSGSYDQADVNGNTNADMYPFVISNACVTGTLANTECFGETWQKVPNAGAIGFLATATVKAEQVDGLISRVKQLTDRPFGVNIPLLYPHSRAIVEIALAEGGRIVVTSAGSPTRAIGDLKLLNLSAVRAGDADRAGIRLWERRSDDPDVGAHRLVATDAIELTIREHPQQPGLQFGGHVTDPDRLIEQQRRPGAIEAFADKNLFDIQDFLAVNIMLPLGGLLIAIFVGWAMPSPDCRDELGLADSLTYRLWRFLLRYLCPIAVGGILLSNLL